MTPWMLAMKSLGVAGPSCPVTVIVRHPSQAGSHVLRERLTRSLARMACALEDGFLLPGGCMLDAMAANLMCKAMVMHSQGRKYVGAASILESAHRDMVLKLFDAGCPVPR